MAIMEKIRRKLELPSGHWQLFSFGRLSEEAVVKSAIWVWAYFRRVLVDEAGQVTNWLDEVVSDRLPVAEMVIFEVGSVFHSDSGRATRGQHISKDIENREVQVEFTDANCELLRRHMKAESGEFLFKNSRFQASGESNAFLLSAKCTSGMPLLIPCTTVLQTFWGRSSQLMHMLLDSRFLDFDRYVINTEKTFLNREKQEAMVWLRQWSRDEDVNFLATIAFDPVAIQRGKDISLRLHAITSEFRHSPKRCIAALPPYTSKMTLNVTGRPIHSESGDYFYVQQILKSSYKPPFNSVKHDRDNDGRQIRKNNGELVPIEKIKHRESQFKIPLSEGESNFELVSDPPSKGETLTPVRLGTFDATFPEIANLKIDKLPQLETEYKGNQVELEKAVDIRWSKLLSTLPNSSISSSEAAKTVLTSANLVQESHEDLLTHSVKKYLDKLVSAYEEFDASQVKEEHGGEALARSDGLDRICLKVLPKFPWKASPICGGNLLFTLPYEVEDLPISWLYSDPDRLIRKRAICLEVHMISRASVEVGYILDIEGRYSKSRDDPDALGKFKSTPIFYIWRKRSSYADQTLFEPIISELEFRTIVKTIAIHGNLALAQPHLPTDCYVHGRKHHEGYIDFKKLVSELIANMKFRESMHSEFDSVILENESVENG